MSTRTTTCEMSGQTVKAGAPRDAKGRAQCPVCGKSYKPTAWSLYRYHMRPVAA